jgi:hypothetical protein
MSKKLEISDIGYIEEIRQRLHLEPNDTSMDEEILKMTPYKRAQLIVGWYHGDESWLTTYAEYLESQGIYLTTNSDDPGIIFEQ